MFWYRRYRYRNDNPALSGVAHRFPEAGPGATDIYPSKSSQIWKQTAVISEAQPGPPPRTRISARVGGSASVSVVSELLTPSWTRCRAAAAAAAAPRPGKSALLHVNSPRTITVAASTHRLPTQTYNHQQSHTAKAVAADGRCRRPGAGQATFATISPNKPPAVTAPELDNNNNHTQPSPITTAGPTASSSTTTTATLLPAPESTAPQLPHNPPSTTPTTAEAHQDDSERPRKRRRRASEARETPGTASKQRKPKRRRAAGANLSSDHPAEPSMRLDSTQEQRTHPSTNGSSSQNGSSPHTNGSAKSGETNGFHTNGHHAEQTAVAVVHDDTPFYGHDREEVTRILLQSLSDLGYQGAAKQLSTESGYELEIPSVAAFRSAVQDGDWEEAEALLFGVEAPAEADGGVMLGNGHATSAPWRKSRTSLGSQNGWSRHGLPLAEGADTTMLKFQLRQQKYLELLEKRDLTSALTVLRNELTPLKRDINRLHALSSLMMCHSADDLRTQAEWDGAQGGSRNNLLSTLSKSIAPSVMIPEHRLATLLTHVQQEQILQCRYHNTSQQPSLYTDHECSADDFPLHPLMDLRNHTDEVWHLAFSPDGTLLATAGKDGLVCVYSTHDWRLQHEFREHDRSNLGPENSSGSASGNSNTRGVVYVAFSPNSEYLISCAQSNEFVVVSLRDGRRVAYADHFDYPVTTAAWLPDSQTFVVGTQGSRRPLGLYSLRSNSASGLSGGGSGSVVRNNELHTWRDPPWDASLKDNPPSFRITDCAVNTDGTRMVASTLGSKILLYDLTSPDRRKLAEWSMEAGVDITSISFSADGGEVLVSMSGGRVWALDAATGEVLMKYVGAVQRDWVVRSAFGGAGENFVVSGSEDGKVYVWRRQTGALVARLDGHGAAGGGGVSGGGGSGNGMTVNAVAWLQTPEGRGVIASAGDDRRVRIGVACPLRHRPVDAMGRRELYEDEFEYACARGGGRESVEFESGELWGWVCQVAAPGFGYGIGPSMAKMKANVVDGRLRLGQN
ncbi:hypothetical protein BAUCODRAFT_26039 [Baudoinia panamericana UAMH 10762]|uniref:CTLH domain-containing protein n=1 Tax=Baudoinia panamericana (strain UAMH 10762) TaxID=717646 RepID=M2LHW3_BAUPA|nr:uncharacterized protein BAUCODRAFT_26039 [Baudoinia panamericana UAMH 10762]EMC93772.1 hypothetical protein BAUCODRAFT_26039 [Baudoinia panamericana UAMH 10762]